MTGEPFDPLAPIPDEIDGSGEQVLKSHRRRWAIASALIVAVAVGAAAWVWLGRGDRLGVEVPASDLRPYTFRYPTGWNAGANVMTQEFTVSPAPLDDVPTNSGADLEGVAAAQRFWFVGTELHTVQPGDTSLEAWADRFREQSSITDVRLEGRPVDGMDGISLSFVWTSPAKGLRIRWTVVDVHVDNAHMVRFMTFASPEADPDGSLAASIFGSVRFDRDRLQLSDASSSPSV
jgi:hypothetical protein